LVPHLARSIRTRSASELNTAQSTFSFLLKLKGKY
jgi:hypothetical protein